jgi:hypothetical protein
MPSPILKLLADNPELMKALHEVLEGQFEISIDPSMSDDVLGQLTRARLTGLAAINRAFVEIDRFRTPPERRTEGTNPAR